jgi:hypothetical protein
VQQQQLLDMQPQRPSPTLVATAVALLGLVLFAHGFFLTRVELAHVAQPCTASSPLHSCFQTPGSQPPYKKLVLVVIDALRLDFVAPGELSRLHDPARSGMYLNRMTTPQHLQKLKPGHVFLARFEADPPTTTMQRLKGMLTGGLPTFIDIKDDVNSEEIAEDNLVSQMVRLGRRVVFMGDDTWGKLFPTAFLRSYPYPSFNVKDLDTVDDGVIRHLLPEMAGKDWDVLVAHFLGVDHAGHRYGPGHPEMSRKLTQLDVVLRQVVRELDANHPDTLLVVLGDHGMSEDGNHGGATEEEVFSALFVYSPHALTGLTPQGQAWLAANGSSSRAASSGDARTLPVVEQIDLVPTLALLLGLPIPFGNLGTVIPELLTHTWTSPQALRSLVHASLVNTKQILDYLQAYSERVAGSLPLAFLQDLRVQFAQSAGAQTPTELLHAFGTLRGVAKSASSAARELWTQFDLPAMLAGALLLSAASAYLARASLPTRGRPGALLGLGLGLLALTSNSFIEAECVVSVFCVATSLAADARHVRGEAQRGWGGALAAGLGARLAFELAPLFRAAGHEGRADALTAASCVALLGFALVYPMPAARVRGVVLLQSLAVCSFWVAAHVFGKAWLPRLVFASGLLLGLARPRAWAMALVVPMVLLLGPAAPLALLLCVACHRGAAEVYGKDDDAAFGVIVALLAVCFFFATGHQSVFGSLRITSPYVGFEEFGYFRGVAMLSLDTFASHAVGAYLAARRGPGASRAFLAVFALRAAVTAWFVLAQRRHLMVWRVFAPKFVFDASAFLAASVFTHGWGWLLGEGEQSRGKGL